MNWIQIEDQSYNLDRLSHIDCSIGVVDFYDERGLEVVSLRGEAAEVFQKWWQSQTYITRL